MHFTSLLAKKLNLDDTRSFSLAVKDEVSDVIDD